MLFLAVLALSTPAPSDMPYVSCLNQQAKSFEVSGEPASDVARATIWACAKLEGHGEPGSPRSMMTPQDERHVTEVLRQSFENLLVTYVVKVRACRHTPKCTVSGLPPAF